MARPRSTGLKSVRKQLADGNTREYFYNRKTGAFLGHDRDAAVARVADLEPDSAPKLPAGSLASLIVEYKLSDRYLRLKPRTRELYRGYLDQIRRDFGDLPFRGIRASHIEAIKQQHRATPSKANMLLALFRILLGYAVKLDYLKHNPAEKPGRLPPAKRSEIWTVEDEDRFMAAARPSLQLAFMLLLFTVQRPSDVLAMTRGRVTERAGRLYIALRQQKTDTLLDVPVHIRLEPILRARLAESDGLLLVPSPRGMAWARRNFSRAWDHDLRRANLRLARVLFKQGLDKPSVRTELEIRHRQRRDLRRTGIVRLAEAGATTPQIAAVSGHSIDYCQRIIDTYLPRRTEVALGGIMAWERAGAAPPNVVALIKPLVKPERQAR